MESITLQQRGKTRNKIIVMAGISLSIVLMVTTCAGEWLRPHSNEQYLHGHSWRNVLNFDGLHYFYNNYQFEHNHAFLPFFVKIITLIKQTIGQNAAIFLLHAINRCIFVLCALELFQILLILKKGDEKFAKWGTFIFIFNPVCIFYHVLYTQSLFCFVSLKAIRMAMEGKKWYSTVFLCLAVCLRSNGIFLSPIIGLQVIIKLFNHLKAPKFAESHLIFAQGLGMLLIIIAPFCWHLYFSYSNICKQNKFPPNACHESIPNIYSYVQEKYWNVGVFRYWNFGNIVFITLGLPAIIVSIVGLMKVYRFQLPIRQQGLYLSFLLLLIVTVLLTNIQSSTRFFSAHPIFILVLAELAQSWRIIRIWMISYYLCGCVIYTVGYPWT